MNGMYLPCVSVREGEGQYNAQCTPMTDDEWWACTQHSTEAQQTIIIILEIVPNRHKEWRRKKRDDWIETEVCAHMSYTRWLTERSMRNEIADFAFDQNAMPAPATGNASLGRWLSVCVAGKTTHELAQCELLYIVVVVVDRERDARRQRERERKWREHAHTEAHKIWCETSSSRLSLCDAMQFNILCSSDYCCNGNASLPIIFYTICVYRATGTDMPQTDGERICWLL